MAGITEYVAAKRDEPDLRGSWGLYSPETKRWLAVTYPNRKAAEHMLKLLQDGRQR